MARNPSSESAIRPSNKKPIWLIDAKPRKRVVLRSCSAAKAPQIREPIAESVTQGSQMLLNSSSPVLSRRKKVINTATFTGKIKNAITGVGLPS